MKMDRKGGVQTIHLLVKAPVHAVVPHLLHLLRVGVRVRAGVSAPRPVPHAHVAARAELLLRAANYFPRTVFTNS